MVGQHRQGKLPSCFNVRLVVVGEGIEQHAIVLVIRLIGFDRLSSHIMILLMLLLEWSISPQEQIRERIARRWIVKSVLNKAIEWANAAGSRSRNAAEVIEWILLKNRLHLIQLGVLKTLVCC